ncbi:MAG: hypothetical protein JXR68_04545 [Bacteroidales bacterium]|nr:hypothetical protein [Bacteroidales bacterium]
MKQLLLFSVFVFFVIFAFGAKNDRTLEIQSSTINSTVSANDNNHEQILMPVNSFFETARGDKWGAFWIAFIIAAIGVYSIYGFAAGIVVVGITYFATNGNKKAFKKAIWGCLSGLVLGALFLILRLSITG